MDADREDAAEPCSNVARLFDSDAERGWRLLHMIVFGGEQSSPPVLPTSNTFPAADLRTLARRMFVTRRARLEHFSAAMFSEPAWDLLLLLYVVEGRQNVTVGDAARLLGSTSSTTSRWVDYLESEQLVARGKHPADLGVVIVTLTDKGTRSLELFLSAASGFAA